MTPALLDTDVLSLYLRQGDIAIVDHCRRYILVTRNRRQFDRIEGLTVADWSEPETSGDAP